MMAVVSLPMYDLPGLEPLWDRWWDGLRGHLAEAGVAGLPEHLTRRAELMSYWSCGQTVLSQTCGYPYVFGLSGTWRLVGTPCFETLWSTGGYYRNLILAAADTRVETLQDLRGARVAFNSDHSHSGYNSIRAMVAPFARDGRFFGAGVETGSHLQTIHAIRDGEAECGSVDCVTYALAARHGLADVSGLQVVGKGTAVPGLPLIVPRAFTDDLVDRYRVGLRAAFEDPRLAAIRADLLLGGFKETADADYAPIGRMEEDACRAGYAALT